MSAKPLAFWCWVQLTWLFLVGCAGAGKGAPQADNAVANPSFEEQDGEVVTGWRPRAWKGHDQALWATESQGRTGRRCVGITSTVGADAAWTTTVQAEVGGWYRLSGWIRTHDVEGGVVTLPPHSLVVVKLAR